MAGMAMHRNRRTVLFRGARFFPEVGQFALQNGLLMKCLLYRANCDKSELIVRYTA